MKFTKEEKKFWQRYYQFNKPSQFHKNWSQIWSVDGDENDAFFYFFTLRVTSIIEVHLKQTLITDKAIEFMTKFKDLQILYLRKHKKITNASISFFNQMNCLERLNITKTKITLTGLCENLNNQNLREIFLDSEEGEKGIEQKGFILKERMPNCNIYLDSSHTLDTMGNHEKPIF